MVELGTANSFPATTGSFAGSGAMGGPVNEMGMRFVGNRELWAREMLDKIRQEAVAKQAQPLMTSLSGHVRTAWTAAKEAKFRIYQEMLEDLRQRKGEYDPNDLAKIRKHGGSEVKMNLTNIKCRAAKAWILDALLPAGERPFMADPTPIPELPPDVEQDVTNKVMGQFQQAISLGLEVGALTPQGLKEAVDNVKQELLDSLKEKSEDEAEKITAHINDELIEGDWYEALSDVVDDIVTFHAGILWGPVIKMKRRLKWVTQTSTGVPIAQVVREPVKCYYRVSPFDIFPAPGARSLQDGYMCHLIRFERKDLYDLMGVEGFDENAIRLVLHHYGGKGYKEFITSDYERMDLEGRHDNNLNTIGTIDCIKYIGPVPGSKLIDWGMDRKRVPDPDAEYEVSAYLVGNYLIGARLNEHPLGKRPYHSASFEKSNDSVWGQGVPRLMRDIQKICDGCARAIVNNMAHASGPMAWLFANRVADGENISSIIPWKIWRMMKDPADTGTQPPLGFFQPKQIVENLLKVFQYFFQQASEVTGVPAYIYGNENVGGAGRTASGLSMLMNAASKGLKNVAKHIDQGIIKPSVEEHWLTIMLYEPEKATGDVEIVARASEYLIIMEQLQIRRQEFLQATGNPIDLEIMGKAGRAEVLSEVAKGLKMRTDRIVPDPKSIKANQQEMMLQAAFQRLAAALNMPVETIAALAQQQPQQGQVPGQAPANLLPDGSPAGGVNMRQAA